VIVAFDFFTVPTLTFQLLYAFFVIEHGRRRVVHFNVTRHPTAEWVAQQLREAFPEASPYRYAILDPGSKFDADVIAFLKATGLLAKHKCTVTLAKWACGTLGGSCSRGILDHVIALNHTTLTCFSQNREACWRATNALIVTQGPVCGVARPRLDSASRT
jgi:putative transposase